MKKTTTLIAQFVTSFADPTKMPHSTLPHVALIGRSNAGKSSFINAITGVKGLARVSNTPGRTQLMNVFEVPGTLWLIDLPGYGYAQASRTTRHQLEDLLIAYLDAATQLRLAIILIDSRIGPTESDREMIGQFEAANIPFLLIANKIDKLSRSQAQERVRALQAAYPAARIIAHSALTGVGRAEVVTAIREGIQR